ncbi:MAG: glycosyltransferase [Gemmatimonadota bacterium]
MKLVFFVHSAVSDWNHGNAHFLRGLLSALARAGHDVQSHEPRGGWSLENLLAEQGVPPVVAFARAYPEIDVRAYPAHPPGELADHVEQATAGADAVIVHEWSSPELVAAVARARRRSRFALLFHDSHHRAWSDPAALQRLELLAFDGALVFGEVLRGLYRVRLGVARSWTFHEAADVERFRPLERAPEQDVVWIGNWGGEERSRELRAFWLSAARALPDLRFAAYGVRYPEPARADLRDAGIEFRGWAASLRVPEIFAASRATLHVPRRAYAEALPGIPTIRVFEALACGVPLVSAPWRDVEGLFRPRDLRRVDTPAEMVAALRELAGSESARREQAERGLETIRARHTCAHRAEELLRILEVVGRAGSDIGQREASCA